MNAAPVNPGDSDLFLARHRYRNHLDPCCGMTRNHPVHNTQGRAMSTTTQRLGPLRKVTRHLGADDRLECGHVVAAWGLVAKRRRCKFCKAESEPAKVAS